MIAVATNDLETHDLNLETVDLYGDLTFLVSGLKGDTGEDALVYNEHIEVDEYRNTYLVNEAIFNRTPKLWEQFYSIDPITGDLNQFTIVEDKGNGSFNAAFGGTVINLKGAKGDKGLTDEEHQNLIDQMMQAEAINSQAENTLHAATLATTAANEAADSAWEAVDEITNALESVSEEIVYFNYGSSTTYKMVDDAVKEGKFIVINYDNDKYLYKSTVSNIHWFAQIGAQNLITVKEIYLQTNNTWGTNSKTYATTAQIPTRVSQLSNDANYITSSDIPSQFIYYVRGDGTTAGVWHATIPEVTEYFEGLTIFYYINIAGASNTTLQINNLDAVKVYVNTTATGISTKYPVSSIIPLTYYEDADGTGSFRVGDYDTNTTYTINYLRNGYSVKNNATHPVYRYMLCGFTEDGLLNPISITSNNITTTKKPSTLGFDPKQSLQYYQDTTTIGVNAHAATNTLRLYTSFEVRYSIQYASSFAADTPIYLKMKLGDDGLLYLPQSTADVANPIWHSTTIEDDDYYYWFIGNIIGTTAYSIHLKPEQPLYKYINGKVEEIDRHTMKPYSSYTTVAQIPTKTSQLNNDAGFITASYDSATDTLNLIGV